MVEVLPRGSGRFTGRTAIPSGTVTRADVSMIGVSATTMPLTSPVGASGPSLGTIWPLPISRQSMESDYTYRVRWSPDDQEHVATVDEFPSLSWLDADPRAALEGIQHLVTEVLADMSKGMEEPPIPCDRRARGSRA